MENEHPGQSLKSESEPDGREACCALDYNLPSYYDGQIQKVYF